MKRINKLLVGLSMALSTTAMAQWTETGTSIYTTTGTKNVGIGTNTPAFALDVYKAGSASANFKSQTGNSNLIIDRGTSSSTSSVSYRTAGTPTWQTGTVGNDNFNIRNIALGNVAISVNAATNFVGFGTNAPTHRLHAEGSGPINLMLRSTSESANIYCDRASSLYDAATNYRTNGVLNWRTGLMGSSDFIIRNQSIGTTPFYVRQSDDYVGIGTVNPGAKLEVDGNSLSLASGGYIMAGGLTSANIAIDNDDIQARNNGVAATLDLNYLGGDIRFRGNLTAATVIKANGNVGIGTSTPSTMLDVEGSSISSTNIITSKVNYVGNTDVKAIDCYSVPANGYGYGVNATGGFIGVNANALGGAYTGSAFGIRATASGTAGIRFGVYAIASGNNTTNYGLYGEASGSGSKNWGGYILGRLNASRHLVVGNTDAAYTETYTGDHSIELLNGRILLKGFMKSNGIQSGIEFYDSLGANAVCFLGNKTSTTMGFYGYTGAGWNLLNMNPATGQVSLGIDKFATGYKLSVGGKVICEELRVQPNTAWPDYVFDNDYALMPLQEVEAHIAQYNHLPGIPNQNEIKTQGIAVGDMQIKQMEKIEELTLYIIQQQKRIEALEAKFNQK